MVKRWLVTTSSRPERGLTLIRVIVALVLGVHSVYRVASGDVSGFGEHLGSIGFPLGVSFAWFITLSTFAASIALILGKWVIPACFCHLIVLVTGIFLVHIHSGWFVVGGGRNGMEYSVVLITCLLAILWSYWPRK
jgi:putative oxidoreductase